MMQNIEKSNTHSLQLLPTLGDVIFKCAFKYIIIFFILSKLAKVKISPDFEKSI